MTVYVPGTSEQDTSKTIMSLQALAAAQTTDETNIATNTAAIAKLQVNYAKVYLTNTQTMATGSREKIQFDTVEFDPSSIWDATNFRFKPTIAGYYAVEFSAQMSSTTSAGYVAILQKNGSDYQFGASVISTSAIETGNATSNGSTLMHFNGSTDYIELTATFVTSTGTMTMTGGLGRNTMAIHLVKAD